MDLKEVGRGREKGLHIQTAHPGSRQLAKGGLGVARERGRSKHKSQRLVGWKCHLSFEREVRL